ncbi:MFS transporter [Nakamurella lactea]|uniref:MFS transporter n=1 Tax=Nakamurella lactea TaxID=459515 RepID=UPI000411012B|nr:MFS transporter [Nakamurella lactea]
MTNPLRRPVFAWFFAGRLTSLLGSSMAPVALVFAVLDASTGPNDLGIVLAANLIPHLLLLLVGGATADRFSRRTVLAIANVGSAVTQGAVATILLTDTYSLAAIAGLEFANGALAAFTTPALRGIVPELVGVDQLLKANALLASTRNASRIIGPSAAGLLVAAAGSGLALAFDAASYAVAAICLLHLDRSAKAPTAPTSLWRDIREGWSYFRSVRWLWPVSLAFFVVNLVQTGPWQILGPQIVSQHSGPQGWGLILSARAIGLLAMSVLAYRLVVRYYLRVTLLASVVAAVPLLGLGVGLPLGWLAVAAIIGGVGSCAAAVTWDTALQEHVPANKLSRVASLDDLLSYAAIPLGQLVAAPLARSFGAQTVCLVAALVWMVATVIPLAHRSVRNLGHPGAVQSAAGAS